MGLFTQVTKYQVSYRSLNKDLLSYFYLIFDLK
jgi:hypothetical protein